MNPTTSSTPTDLRREIETVLENLHAKKDAWVRTDARRRIELLRQCIDGLVAAAPEWVERACEVQGLDPHGPIAGEIWITGPMVTVRGFRLMAEALAAGGCPHPRRVRSIAGERTAAAVFPHSVFDRLLFMGVEAEVWVQPGKPASQGAIYAEKARGKFAPGRVCLVLGAGNISSIPPLDTLYKLFAEDQVVVLKPNPVNAFMGPVLERALAPLVEEGVFAVLEGGREAGEILASHRLVDTLHLTGSHRTHDAIVWGATPEEQERRKAASDPIVAKRFTSELGCVTPVFVVPGPWSESDLRFQAENVSAMVAHNASFNCNAAKALVLGKGWDLAGTFLDHVRRALAATAPRRAYYPGAEDRYRRFLERYPKAEPLGVSGEGIVPWTLLPDVPPRKGEYALTEEAFCGVLAQTWIDAATAPDFLGKLSTFAGEALWGTLSCILLVHPRTAREHAGPLDRAVAELRYGGIAINAWTGLNYGLGNTPWNAFPGHTETDIVSGHGVVHNAMLFDYPEKTVLKAPFRPWPKPVWFADHRTLRELGIRMTHFEASPSWLKLPGIFAAAVRG